MPWSISKFVACVSEPTSVNNGVKGKQHPLGADVLFTLVMYQNPHVLNHRPNSCVPVQGTVEVLKHNITQA